MAKGNSGITVVSGKTLANLINLQMSTQDVLKKLSDSMQDAADKKSGDVQTQLLSIQQKLLDVNLDNFKLNKKNSESQSKAFEDLSKGLKDWKTWGDKLKDLKGAMQDKMSPDSIKKSIMKGLNIGGIFNEKMLAMDYKKQIKAVNPEAAKDKKKLNSDAAEYAKQMMESMRAQNKIDNLKKRSGLSDEQLKGTKAGDSLLGQRNDAANSAQNLLSTGLGKSAKDVSNKMGGNAAGISVPLLPAEAQDLTVPGTTNKEGQLEQAEMIQQQTEFLQRIADNTDRMAGKDQEGNQKQDDSKPKGMLSGLVDSVLGLFSNSFFSAIKSLFSGRALLRVISKVFAPAMIIGSLVNGIMDGFKVWQDTGNLGEALIAGLGGVLEFITFGLFDKDTVTNIVQAVSGFVSKYIMQPISNLVSGLGEAFDTYIAQPFKQAFDSLFQMFVDLGQLFTDYVVTPIQNAFTPIADFFSEMIDSVINFFKSIEIPGVSFKVPLKDDPITFGPWRPFDDNPAAQTQAEKVAPSSGKIIADASKNNADQQAVVDGQAKRGDVNTQMNQVNQNSITNTTVKPSVRNQESSQSKYLAARY